MTSPGRRERGLGDGAPLLALIVVLAAFLFSVFASTVYHWHSEVTGPLTAFCAVALVACGVWLNRAAGSDDGEDEGPE